jgi:CxxC-x17-CxxC domain-containing protein
MGDFRPERKGRSGGERQSRNSRFGGRRSGGFGRGDRRPVEMHEATCAKCGKQCEVPFRPTGDRPVLCSDCFRNDRDSGSRGGSDMRRNFGSRESRGSSQSGISSDQLDKINAKLDKILGILEMIESEDEEESEDKSE